MTVAALMLVKDEADVVGYTIDHLLDEVDAVYVLDNLSTDGTAEILETRRRIHGGRVVVELDGEVGYWQADKTTILAHHARADGHTWGVPCDADEFWRVGDGSRIRDVLESLPDDYLFATADLYDHKATGYDDPAVPNPALRMGWRFVRPGALPKVAVRLVEGLRVGMGNHDATVAGSSARISSTGSPPTLPGSLIVEHYPWRSEEQFLRKITNGARAYAASNLPDEYGAHWRAFGMPEDFGFDGRVRSWFREWGYSERPDEDPYLGYFPFPAPAEHR